MVKSNSIYKNIFFCFFVMLLIHISLYSTPLSVLIYIFIPPVIAYAVYAFGFLVTLMLCLASVIFNTVTSFLLPEMSIFLSLFNTLSVITPGIVCGIFMSKKAKVCDTIIAVALTVIIFPLVSLAYAKYAESYNFTKDFSDFIGQFVKQYQLIKSVYPEIGESFNGNEDEFFAAMAIYVPGLFPAVMVIISTIYSLVIYAVSKMISRRKMIENSFFIQGLDCIYLPKYVSIALIITMIFLLIETDSITMMAAINVFIITLAFYMLQGLSLIEYKLKQKNLNSVVRFLTLMGIIIVLLIASAIMPILNPVFALSLLGMSDSTSDYRKLNMNKDELNEN